MSFRSDEDARVHRIDALEGELGEKDAEIARLRAQLEADQDQKEADAFFAASEREDADERAAVAAKGIPSGDVWKISTHDPRSWMFGLAWIAVVGAVVAYLGFELRMSWETLWPALAALVGGFFLFQQNTLTLDRRAGTVTRTTRYLFVPVKRTVRYAGEVLRIERRHYSPEHGDSYWNGHVFLGDVKLFAKREEEAKRIADQISAFLGIPCHTADGTAAQRRALLPLILTVAGAVIFAAFFLLREHWGG